jgi:hypothetical protein
MNDKRPGADTLSLKKAVDAAMVKISKYVGGWADLPDALAEETAARRFSFARQPLADVRYWPLADISSCTAHVRSRG